MSLYLDENNEKVGVFLIYVLENKQISWIMLTPNTPLIHTSFTYWKLNMDDFSVPAGPLGYVDSTQEV